MVELWFTEDPTHPIIIGTLITFVLSAIWFMARKRILFFLALIALVSTISIVFVERAIVTDREQITAMIFELAHHVSNNDADSIVQHIDPVKVGLQQQVRRDMQRYRFGRCRLLGFNEKSINGDPANSAFFDFAAYASELKTGQQGSARVALEFKKSQGNWQIVGYDYMPSNSQRAWQMKY